MTWFMTQRQNWIHEMLAIYGYINRRHLILKFGISEPQASNDLTRFTEENPGVMHYDNRRRAYVASNDLANQEPD